MSKQFVYKFFQFVDKKKVLSESLMFEKKVEIRDNKKVY